MKKLIGLAKWVTLCCLFPSNLSAQLSWEEREALKVYIEKTPSLSKYENKVKEAVLRDPSIVEKVRDCQQLLIRYGSLDRASKMTNMSAMATELDRTMPELKNRFLPGFDKKAYSLANFTAEGESQISPARFSSLITLYNNARMNDKLNPENSFGSMVIMYAEKVEELRKVVSDKFQIPVTDKYLTAYLEMQLYESKRLKAIQEMNKYADNQKAALESTCLKFLPQKLIDENEKDLNPANWVGDFTGPTFTIKMYLDGTVLKGGYDMRVGSNSEKMEWQANIQFDHAKGDFILTANDQDKTTVFAGPLTLTLIGDTINYEMVVKNEPVITWKEGHKPYEVDKRAGTRLFGPLRRIPK